MGARIEMGILAEMGSCTIVAPLVGARIEIYILQDPLQPFRVAPLVGARIEIKMTLPYWKVQERRSPRGSAD